MKYLKTYKLFENVDIQDIKEICYELEDLGMRVKISKVNNQHLDPRLRAVVARFHNNEFFKKFYTKNGWVEIKDVALRLKDYLGDNYRQFMYRKYDIISISPSLLSNYKIIELEENTNIKEPIYAFIIKFIL